MWSLNTRPATWTDADNDRHGQMLLEIADIHAPDEFSWTISAHRAMVMGTLQGALEDWLVKPVDQMCCGSCYATCTTTVLRDRMAIKSMTPHSSDPKAVHADPLQLSACIAGQSGFDGCGGGAVDQRLGRWLETNGVPRGASSPTCPRTTLPQCRDANNIRSVENSFVMLRQNTSIRTQILQGPIAAAFRCPSKFVDFASTPMLYTPNARAFGGWYKTYDSGPWTSVFAWHGPSDNGNAGHAVAIVGWLRVTLENPRHAGARMQATAWIARNSFGTRWGDSPYEGADYRGYMLMLDTDSGFNGALGVGECNDNAEICRSALGCDSCTQLIKSVKCTGCVDETVGAVVFDASTVGQPVCQAWQINDTCKSSVDGITSGRIERRCDTWPASTTSVIYPCFQRVYLQDSFSPDILRETQMSAISPESPPVQAIAKNTANTGSTGHEGHEQTKPKKIDNKTTTILTVSLVSAFCILVIVCVMLRPQTRHM
jgi:hypothetical protein